MSGPWDQPQTLINWPDRRNSLHPCCCLVCSPVSGPISTCSWTNTRPCLVWWPLDGQQSWSLIPAQLWLHPVGDSTVPAGDTGTVPAWITLSFQLLLPRGAAPLILLLSRHLNIIYLDQRTPWVANDSSCRHLKCFLWSVSLPYEQGSRAQVSSLQVKSRCLDLQEHLGHMDVLQMKRDSVSRPANSKRHLILSPEERR